MYNKKKGVFQLLRLLDSSLAAPTYFLESRAAIKHFNGSLNSILLYSKTLLIDNQLQCH